MRGCWCLTVVVAEGKGEVSRGVTEVTPWLRWEQCGCALLPGSHFASTEGSGVLLGSTRAAWLLAQQLLPGRG